MIEAFIKALFRQFGFQVTRLARQSGFTNSEAPLQFGPYKISTNNEMLRQSYANHPENNRVITRLVSVLHGEGNPCSVIDIGANCGDSAALAKCGGATSILCIEGDPKLRETLHLNVDQLGDVTVRSTFLGESRGKIVASVEKAGWNSTLVTAVITATKQTIDIDTLDNLANDWSALNCLRLIKCDAEGCDVQILFGGRSTLSNRQPVLLFEYNREAMAQIGESGFRIFSFLRGLNYETTLFYDAFGRFLCAGSLEDVEFLRDLHDYADGKSGKVYYYDVVTFSKNDAFLAQRFLELERQHRQHLILSEYLNN
jgi:FkbM family methyltransferase